jgi:hypothetical protein
MTAFDLFKPDGIEAINASIAAQLAAYEHELRTEVTRRESVIPGRLCDGAADFATAPPL